MGNAEVDDSGNGADILLIVIISIICINLLMIYKVIAEGRKKVCSPNRAKHMILILQAFGDIFLALFPLNIRLQALLENPSMENIVCWQRILAHTYLFHLMPFIHATGIIVLTAESFLFWGRHGGHPPSHPEKGWFSLRNLLASFLPWGLGIITVMPLVLVGFDFETCSVEDYSLPRIESFYWISIILPGVLAVTAACSYILSSTPRASQLSQLSGPVVPVSSSVHIPCLFENRLPSYNEAIQTSADNMKTTLHSSQYSDYRCPECCKPFADYRLQKNEELFMDDFGHGRSNSLSQSQTGDLLSTIVWEKWNRLAVAILFCACNMPSAVLDLIFLSGGSDGAWPESAQVSIGLEALYRLLVLRSLISPLVWINEYS